MLVGQKDKDREVFNYPRVLPAKREGFSLIETLVISFILVVVIAALSLVLNIGNFSNTISGAKLELQQDVRRASDWIINDLRQTSRMQLTVLDQLGSRIPFVDLGDNEVFTDPIFPICAGFDGSNILWSSNQIGYTFDNLNQKITRTDSAQPNTWEFYNISNLEFRKIGLNLLRITISGEKIARGTIRPTLSLQEEVKLRN